MAVVVVVCGVGEGLSASLLACVNWLECYPSAPHLPMCLSFRVLDPSENCLPFPSLLSSLVFVMFPKHAGRWLYNFLLCLLLSNSILQS